MEAGSRVGSWYNPGSGGHEVSRTQVGKNRLVTREHPRSQRTKAFKGGPLEVLIPALNSIRFLFYKIIVGILRMTRAVLLFEGVACH